MTSSSTKEVLDIINGIFKKAEIDLDTLSMALVGQFFGNLYDTDMDCEKKFKVIKNRNICTSQIQNLVVDLQNSLNKCLADTDMNTLIIQSALVEVAVLMNRR